MRFVYGLFGVHFLVLYSLVNIIILENFDLFDCMLTADRLNFAYYFSFAMFHDKSTVITFLLVARVLELNAFMVAIVDQNCCNGDILLPFIHWNHL